MQRKLPSIDPGALNRDWKENIRGIQIVVVEEVFCPRQEVIRVERPSMQRNRDTELMFLVSFTVKRDKSKILPRHKLQQRAGRRKERRRLIEVSVEAANDPVELWKACGYARIRARGIFDNCAGKMCLAKAGVQGQPRCRFDLIFKISRTEAAGRPFNVGLIQAWGALVVVDQFE